MIINFLMTKIGRWVASALVVLVAFGGWLFVHDRKVERRATEKVVAKIGKANDQAVDAADRARAASRNSGVRGKRDPYSLD